MEKQKKNLKEIAEYIPNNNDTYCYINLDSMIVKSEIWTNCTIDFTRLNKHLVFKNKDIAREYLKYLEEKEQYLNPNNLDWENSTIKKWFYMYDYANKKFFIDYEQIHKENIPYFKTKTETQEFLKKYKWQIKYDWKIN